MIEQVLINLVKNASEAAKKKADKQIIMRTYIDDKSRARIDVEDN